MKATVHGRRKSTENRFSAPVEFEHEQGRDPDPRIVAKEAFYGAVDKPKDFVIDEVELDG